MSNMDRTDRNCGSILPYIAIYCHILSMRSQALQLCLHMLEKSLEAVCLRPDPTHCAMALPCPGNDAKLQCDGILLQGSLIVNESMLTGWMLKVHESA